MQWKLPLCFVLFLCPTVFDPMDCSTQAFLSSTISQSLIKFVSIESVMLSNHLILCHLLHLLLSTFPSIWVFYNESALCNRWPKYWRFSISPSSPSGLVSFRIDWFDLPAVQGSLKSAPTPQFKSINFLVLSLLYGPTLTSICEYWENHSYGYMNLCQQSDVSGF